MKSATVSGLFAVAVLIAGCVQGSSIRSVQGDWGSNLTDGCTAWRTTITTTALSIRVMSTALDQEIDLKEDSGGATADVYLLGRNLSAKLHAIYPIRLTVENDQLTFSSDSTDKLGTAWLHLLQAMQPLHRCGSS